MILGSISSIRNHAVGLVEEQYGMGLFRFFEGCTDSLFGFAYEHALQVTGSLDNQVAVQLSRKETGEFRFAGTGCTVE